MADDLDAFFDEVEEAAKEAVAQTQEKENDGEPASRPTKKQRIDHSDDDTAAASITNNKSSSSVKQRRSKGIVVASSGSTLKSVKKETSSSSLPSDNSGIASSTINASLHPSIGSNFPSSGTSTDPALPPVPPLPSGGSGSLASSGAGTKAQFQQDLPKPQVGDPDKHHTKAHLRVAAGKSWVDTSLNDWPENDFRIFVGNLSKDVQDPQLYQHFSKYPSLAMVKIIRDSKTGQSKGFGFVSLMNPLESAQAIREMDQTWLSSRPIRVKRSDWKDRDKKQVQKINKKQTKQLKKKGYL